MQCILTYGYNCCLYNAPSNVKILYANKYTKFAGANIKVWIIASSLIHYAHHHAFIIYADQHLHLQAHNISLKWFGKRGMIWEDVEPKLRELIGQFGYPNVLMLHCGGNSIGTMSLRHLQKFMKLTIVNIQNMLPNCRIIWSQILPRKYYRHMFSREAAEKARARINTSLSNFILARNGGYINYPDLKQCTLKLFPDGTHLSDVAQTLFLNGIQGGLYSIIRKNVQIYPPPL